jgi:tetratricopeptide (TPR) repeat protein
LNPTYVPAIALLASLYYSKPDYAEALRLYLRATALRPDNADLLYRRGLCEERLDRPREALASFGAAINRDSTHVHAYAHIGQVWFQLGKYDSSIMAFERAVALEEDNPSLYVNIALAWERRDSLERAAHAFGRAIKAHQPDQIAKVYSQLAALYFNAKQMRKARDAYRRSLQVDPSYSLSQFYLAVTHDELGEHQTAVREYRKFLKLAAGDSTMADKVKAARNRVVVLEKRR